MISNIENLAFTKLIKNTENEENTEFRFFVTDLRNFSSYSNRNFYMIAIPTKKFNGVLNTYLSIDDLIKKSNCDIVAECTIMTHKSLSTSFIYKDVECIMNDHDIICKELGNTYVYPKYRGYGLGKYFVKIISEYVSSKGVLVTKAGALIKEYPNDPGDKKCGEIADKVSKFYEKCGFVSINDFCQFERTHALMYVNQVSAIPLINFYKRNHMNPMFSN